MISDTTLTNLSNGLGMSAMLLIVVYHFVAVNGKRMEAQGGKTVADIVSFVSPVPLLSTGPTSSASRHRSVG